MKRLPKKQYDSVIVASQSAEQFLKRKDDALTEQVNALSATSMWPVGLAMTGVSAIGCLFTGFWTAELRDFDGHITDPGHPWPLIGWVFVATLILGLMSWVTLGVRAVARTKALQGKKRAELQADLDGDSLYARAKLIMRAIGDYGVHCRRYRDWQDAVDEELTAADEEAAERYHDFITRSNRVLGKAIKNFENAAMLAERQLAFQKDRPQLGAKPDSMALAELVAQLNEPVELPPDVALADPRAALEFEETLATLSPDFDERALAARIEAAAERRALPAKAASS